MMGGVEGIGEAVTGGMIARAAEPSAGEHGEDGHRSGVCLNCAALLAGPYCHQCGQAAHVHRTLSAFWHDLLHGVLHFEGKIWRTLPLLAWRPGELTRRYVDGERARFVSPVALFLFAIFMTFAVLGALGSPLVGAGEQVTVASERGPPVEFHSGWAALDHGVEKARKDPALLLYKMRSNAYKFSWALIPIAVPFLALLFLHRRQYRRRYNLLDHTVFITYSISFVSLLLIVSALLIRAGLPEPVVDTAALIIIPVHMYRQLRGTYALTPRSALWRTVVLALSVAVTLFLFVLLLLVIGLTG